MSTDLTLPQLEQRLRRHVEVLAQAPRVPGSRAHRDAADYIANHLQDAGFAVQEAGFFDAGPPGLNLFAHKLPEDRALPLFVIGAHYDTVPQSPGADDNASAVACLLELARWLGLRLTGQQPRRLLLAAYDLEEYGMAGSLAHCRELRQSRTDLFGMISLEMLGFTDARPGSQRLPPQVAGLYPEVGDFIGVCGNEQSRTLVQQVEKGLRSVEGLPVQSLVVPGRGESLPPVRFSDHSSFWDHDYPALMITDTAFLRNPHYHQPSDLPATLDYAFLAKVTAGVCTAARSLLAAHD